MQALLTWTLTIRISSCVHHCHSLRCHSGPGSASQTEERPVGVLICNGGVRPAAIGVSKPDRQSDKRLLDQPNEPLQKAYAKIDA